MIKRLVSTCFPSTRDTIMEFNFINCRIKKNMYRWWHNTILISITTAGLAACKQPLHLPQGDADNGGLLLPRNFEALVVVDSIGPARHLAVNDNGDIYVKLTYNDAMNGAGGSVGLRDLNKDGRADSVVYFGDYKDVGSSA